MVDDDPPDFYRSRGVWIGVKKWTGSTGSLVPGNSLLQEMMIPFGKEDSWTGSWISVWEKEAEDFLATTVWKISCWKGNLLTYVLGRGLNVDPLLHEVKNIGRAVVFAYTSNHLTNHPSLHTTIQPSLPYSIPCSLHLSIIPFLLSSFPPWRPFACMTLKMFVLTIHPSIQPFNHPSLTQSLAHSTFPSFLSSFPPFLPEDLLLAWPWRCLYFFGLFQPLGDPWGCYNLWVWDQCTESVSPIWW